MQVVIDALHELVAPVLIGHLERGVQRLVLRHDRAPTELADRLLRGAAGAFDDHHRALEAGSQVVEDPVDRIELSGDQRPPRVYSVRFDENVLPGVKAGPDPVVDGHQRIEDVLPPVVPFDQGDLGSPIGELEVLRRVRRSHSRILRRRPRIDRRLLLRLQGQPLGDGNGPRARQEIEEHPATYRHLQGPPRRQNKKSIYPTALPAAEHLRCRGRGAANRRWTDRSGRTWRPC